MIIRCLSCGAENSLDSVIENDAAAQALAAALDFAPGGKALVRYMALFRPAQRRLTWPRVAALLAELLPLMTRERIERDGRTHDAPLAAWAIAFEKCLQARDAGTLRTPLKNHGYLFEIVIAEAARSTVAASGAGAAAGIVMGVDAGARVTLSRGSAVANAVNTLQQRHRRVE